MEKAGAAKHAADHELSYLEFESRYIYPDRERPTKGVMLGWVRSEPLPTGLLSEAYGWRIVLKPHGVFLKRVGTPTHFIPLHAVKVGVV